MGYSPQGEVRSKLQHPTSREDPRSRFQGGMLSGRPCAPDRPALFLVLDLGSSLDVGSWIFNRIDFLSKPNEFYRPSDKSLMREAVIVASSRTPLAKSFRGSFNLTRPDDLAANC